ncbi:hypothetical protein [Streptomyces sp. NBC_00370]|uniref:hypothetical protein n=1 Tax=Streptomyces sp. NBC_00370 TaxID=2975728 RepID=UPI002E265F43
MDDAIEQSARATAQRMTSPVHASLVEDVEATLATRDTPQGPGQYTDPTALAGLIVSIATLAWTMYNDIRGRGAANPSTDTITRRVRLQINEHESAATQLSAAERDRTIDITVEETLNAAQNHP